MPDGYLTTAQAAAFLKIEPQSVRRAIGRKRLKAEKQGRDYLIAVTEVERYKAERKMGRPKGETK